MKSLVAIIFSACFQISSAIAQEMWINVQGTFDSENCLDGSGCDSILNTGDSYFASFVYDLSVSGDLFSDSTGGYRLFLGGDELTNIFVDTGPFSLEMVDQDRYSYITRIFDRANGIDPDYLYSQQNLGKADFFGDGILRQMETAWECFGEDDSFFALSGSSTTMAEIATVDFSRARQCRFFFFNAFDDNDSVVELIDNDAIVTVGPPPPDTQIACAGFEAPMADFPVKARKQRVFPLKAALFDETGLEMTAEDLVSTPIVQVLYESVSGSESIDVTNQLLSAGHASEGNQFAFSGAKWQFNLRAEPYSAPGMYLVSMASGDATEYTIDPSCVTSFVVE